MEARESPLPDARVLPAWAATWLAILLSTLVAVVVLARLSADGARAAVEAALADHLGAQAGEADGVFHALPLELILAMGGERSVVDLRAQVDDLARHAGLRGLALLSPAGEVVGNGGAWLPAPAELDLIARAATGETVTGALYRDQTGELYQTAYRPLTGHPGWVVAAEGSAATLGAVDELERTQRIAGAVVVVVAAAVGGVLAALVSSPLRRLAGELAGAAPGTPPAAVGTYGFREVRRVAAAARGLLGAIRTRDLALQQAHRSEIDQLTRMAAELAHEVGNPLNAVALSVDRLRGLDDPLRRAPVIDRVQAQLAEMEAIVERLRDLTRPLDPQFTTVDLAALIDAVLVEGLTVTRDGTATLVTDRGLVTQVLRNLLLNAQQAGAHAAEVRVRAADAQVEVRVVDDGPGVPPAEVDRAFDWFHTTRATGSGLGLPVSRRLAEAVGGTLTLMRPSPATFCLTLPLGPR